VDVAPVLIVGGGVAAYGAVSGLRRAGSTDHVLVLGREADPPYQRPPLSKRYLLGEVEREELMLPPLEAELRLGAEVVEIDLEARAVRLLNGDRLGYRRLLIATGARPRRLVRKGGMYLRQIDDADRLREVLRSGTGLEVVGAGFIGCEVAAIARTLRVPVTLYEALAQPLLRVLGPELGAWLAGVHREHGVDLRTGVAEAPEPGPATLVAVGSEPNVELAEAAGLGCEGGILVDATGRTSAPDVYAAGDCARFWSPSLHEQVRVEHFQTAVRLGEAVGAAIAGVGEPFEEVPWFWSDQYTLNIQYVGAGLHWDEIVVRGRFGMPPFTVFYLESGRLRAAAGVNDGRIVSRARRLIGAGTVVQGELLRQVLADSSQDLRSVARRR
jgi:3-phenylpropionate/trans-cinnamate dioxygenase ferredoxin reductase component